ncbi:FAD-dependent oxidoreductase [Metapseudomonas resinovorans]|uniref:Histamine dehydrogenase n=1 Tax=Metapseudomonas resinovorans NBRC 106553 TaxID=1245471 RepID=S6AND3_METRE|nr:FAD-dependent oxidoreductase [Pseudomonas resinovorans]BAN50465.1 histamine dehydrogenase [Pseudomonas resinovorans NBRC 106553]
MPTDPRYSILFEPVRIGPVTAPNRFFQVPHCNGMGHLRPNMLAAMRGIKAEGGWGSVCTEVTDIHPTSDQSPYAEGKLWDDGDIPAVEAMTRAVHAHGALAGIELAHLGLAFGNQDSRMAPLAPSHRSIVLDEPIQARAMSLSDIRDLRKWHRDAALRAKRAGFDIIYCYAAHNLSILQQFLLPRYNSRSDQYGGSLTNRVRLLREVLEDTKEAVGDRCAVALRFAVDELMGADGLRCEEEGREVVEMLAEIPDLWDVNISGWPNDSGTSRFTQEGFQEPYIAFVKRVTSKPVVGVGRYTSPDTMVRLIKSGMMDLVGAARPSIADPFLPNKIREDRLDDIRECIGCNICVSADYNIVPLRCTQNPTMGEEWRRGWHPERMNPKRSDDSVLVVGAGPAGLEAARALGERGYNVALAEAGETLGGRVMLEGALPGLAEWRRVADYRILQLQKSTRVDVYRDSRLSAEDVLGFGFAHVLLATGSTWRDDGVGRTHHRAIPGLEHRPLFTPDDLMAGRLPRGEVLIFDDESFYMGGVLAELLVKNGCQVTLVTPFPVVSPWADNTMEQGRIQGHLLELGVKILANQRLSALDAESAVLACSFTDRESRLHTDAVVLVTERSPNEELLLQLQANPAALHDAGIKTLRPIGDCFAPGIIASAVYHGHQAARELEEPEDAIGFRRERIIVIG